MNSYPDDWDRIAREVKDRAGWRCVRCGHPAEAAKLRAPCDEHCDPDRHPGGLNDGRQRILTVHHLDGDKSNCAWWNLTALCQVCHLHIQGKVQMDRTYVFEHSDWFKPYVGGYYASQSGLPTARTFVEEHADVLAALPHRYPQFFGEVPF